MTRALRLLCDSFSFFQTAENGVVCSRINRVINAMIA